MPENPTLPAPYLPASFSSEASVGDAWDWYGNIPWELQQAHLSATEKAKMAEYYVEAGLLRSWRRPFFRAHFSDSFTQAARYLAGTSGPRRILDLGCGCGTQAIYFASMGFEVEAIDADSAALAILEKRAKFYSDRLGRELRIRTHDANTLTFDYAAVGPLGGIYSMFAFNMMQPTDQLLDRMLDGCSPTVRIAFIDGNNSSWLPRLLPSRRRDVKSPTELSASLGLRGFRIDDHAGAIALPPALWFVLGPLAGMLDRPMCKSWLLALSHQVLAERTA